MACFHPLTGVRGEVNPKSGKRPLLFDFKLVERSPVKERVPCGQCIGCRLDRSAEWADRCVKEASLYARNCFLTLTFDDAHLPRNLSLDVRDWQLFMKRLRKFGGSSKENPIRFFHCGEYGALYKRPHYHACIFNFDFDDKVYLKSNGRGDKTYTSKSLEVLWPNGFGLIGAVTFDSAAYVARYVVDKVTGPDAERVSLVTGLSHYERADWVTGEVFDVKPEYVTMSRRPGLARVWYDKFKSDVYPHGYSVVNGARRNPPRFFDNIYELTDPELFCMVKQRRVKEAGRRWFDNTSDRLAVREEFQLSQISSLSRSLEGK